MEARGSKVSDPSKPGRAIGMQSNASATASHRRLFGGRSGVSVPLDPSSSRLSIRVFLIALLLATCGCGTIYRHQADNYGPFSGVEMDALTIGGSGDAGLIIGSIFDLPLSAVADTLVLPYDLAHPPRRDRTMKVNILVPADRQRYGEMITGKQDFRAAAELPFISKKVLVPYSRDLIRATAQAAARETPDQAGEGVSYFKIQDGTAYVLLPMDCDGWAGVSFARACSHPIVERSLLQFKNIRRVVWDYAPNDKARYGVPAINQ